VTLSRTRSRRRREERWYSKARGYCQNPECGRTWGLVLHHVTYEQHVRGFGGDVDDPDNSMTLCTDCHERHHHTSWRLKATLLTDDNVRFMIRLFGGVNRAAAYLRRYYDVEGR
jgi:hypothetical protein